MKKNWITDELLTWYKENKRVLPWRKTKKPYEIWLSEVILQQTRVDQGLPYYKKFIKKYPTIHDLADAPIDDVLRTWQGLGYYSRARNLHKCAKLVVEKYGGHFPEELEDLKQLPGIGPYTAAAIASIAFGKKEAVVDGNVIRVITRLFGIEDDINNGKTTKKINDVAGSLISETHPDLFNQAIMEFGALHCTPQNPRCDCCKFALICEARSRGIQNRVPYKLKKLRKRIRYFNYLVITITNRYLLKKRTNNDIWNGLFEFFLIETDQEATFDQLKLPDIMSVQSSRWSVSDKSEMYKHLLSHQTIMAKFYIINTSAKFSLNLAEWPGYQLYSKQEIIELPKSILTDRYLGEKII